MSANRGNAHSPRARRALIARYPPRMRNLLLFVFALLLACADDASVLEPTATVQVAAAPSPEPAFASLDAMQARPQPPVQVEDPYQDAENWCYEVDDIPPCRREGDMDADPLLPTDCTPDPRTGRRRYCIDPWWVPGHEQLCVPRELNRREQKTALREIEAFVYRRDGSDHEGICQPQGWWRPGKGHTVASGYCNPTTLTTLLQVVSWRETRLDPRWTHLLNADQEAAIRSYHRKRKVYEKVNPHYGQWQRWRSRGPYGTNPALHLWRFDRTAPPEVLCNRVVATETYMETLRHCHPKLVALRGDLPDWWDLHHCASGGSLERPEQIPTQGGSFHRRALKAGLDPYQQVPFEWLGTPIDHNLSAVRAIEGQITSYIEG